MALFRVRNLGASIVIAFWMIGERSSMELKIIQSVFRHGDRYPLSFGTTKFFYPLNPHGNVSWYPNSDGGLTNEGKSRSYELGKVLRARYGDWFGERYAGRNFKFFSAYENERGTTTALLTAAGIFCSSNESQRWNPSLNWEPVPVSLLRYPDIILFYGCLFCTNYVEILEKTKLSDPTIIENDRSMKKFYDYVSSNTGAPVNNRVLFYLYMELLALVSAGLSPPKWSEDIFTNGSLEAAAILEYRYSSWTEELRRITGGIWLRRWLRHVDDYTSSGFTKASSRGPGAEKNKRAFFYSGHDINVAGIMNTLRIFYSHVPNYAAAINLELHEDEKQRYYVKVAHRDSGKFVDHLVPGCPDVLCPLDTFRTLFANVVKLNETEACGSLIKFSGKSNV